MFRKNWQLLFLLNCRLNQLKSHDLICEIAYIAILRATIIANMYDITLKMYDMTIKIMINFQWLERKFLP